MRDNFSSKIKDILAKRVGFLCSNPKCKKLTCGPNDEPSRIVNIGVAAHITAASKRGPRFDNLISKEERKSELNGIWLCQNCAKMIDNDVVIYCEEILRNWKADAENHARNLVESSPITDYNWKYSLSKQLTTFSRVDFEIPALSLSKSELEPNDLIKIGVKPLTDILTCSYLETSSLIKRDNFIFGLTVNLEQQEDHIFIWGELITHLTPFAYRFGVLADLLSKFKIDELYTELGNFPQINIKRQLVFGEFIPFKVSRVNPSKVFIECIAKDAYNLKGNLTTSDLIYYFSGGVNGSLIIFDDQNDKKCIDKHFELLNKTMF